MGYIKLKKSSFLHNIKTIQQRDHNFAIVLKDNAYGHGLIEIASLAKDAGVKRAVVRSFDEAKKVESFFSYILILADAPRKAPFHFAINALDALYKAPSKSKIELKVDSGMHRNGIAPQELEDAFKLIKKKNLYLKGLFTHFRSADELGSDLFWQHQNFQDIKKEALRLCQKYNLPRPLFHSQNSAALFRMGLVEDFSRVGIAAYGYLDMQKPLSQPNLKPVLSLWAKKIASRKILPGQRVGYGGVFEAKEPLLVSSYDIGYADGIFRTDRFVCAKGEELIGRVSMDSMIVASIKEEICIFDDAKRVAKFYKTIPYEVLVKLTPSLARIII